MTFSKTKATRAFHSVAAFLKLSLLWEFRELLSDSTSVLEKSCVVASHGRMRVKMKTLQC